MMFLFFFHSKGYESAVQVDGTVYDLQTLKNTVVASDGVRPILFYTRIKSTNSPILIEVTLQDSVGVDNKRENAMPCHFNMLIFEYIILFSEH